MLFWTSPGRFATARSILGDGYVFFGRVLRLFGLLVCFFFGRRPLPLMRCYFLTLDFLFLAAIAFPRVSTGDALHFGYTTCGARATEFQFIRSSHICGIDIGEVEKWRG